MTPSALIYVDNNLRKVKPYEFTYKTWAKGRWIGRTIIDVFSTEFRDRCPDYYLKALNDGRVQVNDKLTSAQYVFKENDLMVHVTCMHEPPIKNEPIQIISETEDHLVVNKPASVPVHATGRYQYNSLVEMLKHDFGIHQTLHVTHRLDRLTSGVVVLAKTAKASDEFRQQLTERSMKKEYICRVNGVFPEEPITCLAPIRIACHKLSLNAVCSDGKDSVTVFRRLSTNHKTSSVVHCVPLTGRQHQIRVHLQYLGYPICNDPLYSSPHWGKRRGRGMLTVEEMQEVVDRFCSNAIPREPPPKDWDDDDTLDDIKPKHRSASDRCIDCRFPMPDPVVYEQSLWLHAFKYTSTEQGWSYETPWPDWASEDYDDSKTIEHFRLKHKLAE